MKPDRSTVLLIVVAILSIAGTGIVAATLTTAEPVGASDDPIFDPRGIDDAVSVGGNSGPPGEMNGSSTSSRSSDTGTITTCIDSLDSMLGVLAFISGIALFGALVYYRFNAAISLLATWTVAPPAMLVYFLVTDCTAGGTTFQGSGGGFSADRAGDALVPTSELPPSMMVGLLGVILVTVVALLYRSAGQEDVVVPEDAAETDEPELGQFAEAAGHAADRIEQLNVGVNNAVYQAWREMTSLLDVDSPDTYTPGEFAEAAIQVGMAADDVEELTELFNEVRYGDKEVGPREERAIEILRTIESEYGDDGSDDDPPAGATANEEDFE